jgi:uncharacterized phage-associated protein
MTTIGEMLGGRAIAVANEFLDLAKDDGSLITPMKLLKLVYFAQGWSLGLRRRPLFNDSVQAWEYGPVVPAVYHEFKHNGSSPIIEKADSYGFTLAQADKALLRRVWEVYGQYPAADLSKMSHDPAGPWAMAKANAPDPSAKTIQIKPAAIEEYFAREAARKNEIVR